MAGSLDARRPATRVAPLSLLHSCRLWTKLAADISHDAQTEWSTIVQARLISGFFWLPLAGFVAPFPRSVRLRFHDPSWRKASRRWHC